MKLLARFSVFASLVLGSLVAGSPATLAADAPAGATAAISYYKQIRPIFQANCQGCHQPAKASGKYVMTDFVKLLAGGESGSAAIVPGKLDDSHLVAMITPVDGKADMPKDRPALAPGSVELIKAWIAAGAPNDSDAYAAPKYDQEHPPVYVRPAAIASLDYSPDGKLLAVTGFNEVLLVDAESTAVVSRLVGKSERIESLRFSPNGTRLAVSARACRPRAAKCRSGTWPRASRCCRSRSASTSCTA